MKTIEMKFQRNELSKRMQRALIVLQNATNNKIKRGQNHMKTFL